MGGLHCDQLRPDIPATPVLVQPIIIKDLPGERKKSVCEPNKVFQFVKGWGVCLRTVSLSVSRTVSMGTSGPLAA